MIMTPYDFAMLTGLGVKGDLIPFNTDIEDWDATYIEWNTIGLYLLSALVTFPRVCFYDSLTLEPVEELPLAVPYSRQYDDRCAHGGEGARAPAARKPRRATRARA
ncbi:hypothetical protein CsSME_00040823 [Camellia sinensis var. sinensis]